RRKIMQPNRKESGIDSIRIDPASRGWSGERHACVPMINSGFEVAAAVFEWFGIGSSEPIRLKWHHQRAGSVR
ncbi:MAG TPA: hypothetical protein VHN20_02475, partial [Beijerinckiaceae bacterium]|nr:hypothetical protein [Beijerinckiaceae bacterium]